MKILVLSPTPTHPVTAGNRARIVSLARALQRLGHTVHFAVASVAQSDMAGTREVFGAHVHVLRWREPHSIGGFLPRVRRKLLRMMGSEAAYLWGLDEYYDHELTAQVAELCARERFDAVMVEYVFMSQAFAAVPPGTLKILDTHDRFALRHRTFLRAGQQPQWFSTSVQEECEGLRRADCVLAIQDQEAAEFVRQLGTAPPHVITVGHLLEVQRRVAPAAADSAVFLASGNPINVEAARYFIDRVLPLILRKQPQFKLLLAGDVGASFTNAGAAVVCLGRVTRVTDAFDTAAVAVNPVQMGTGLNIKMLEALACAVPCVSTETGSRGLERHRGVAFECVGDTDAAAMADAILSLLADSQRATALGEAGQRIAEEWNRTQLAGLVEALANAPANARIQAAPPPCAASPELAI